MLTCYLLYFVPVDFENLNLPTMDGLDSLLAVSMSLCFPYSLNIIAQVGILLSVDWQKQKRASKTSEVELNGKNLSIQVWNGHQFSSLTSSSGNGLGSPVQPSTSTNWFSSSKSSKKVCCVQYLLRFYFQLPCFISEFPTSLILNRSVKVIHISWLFFFLAIFNLSYIHHWWIEKVVHSKGEASRSHISFQRFCFSLTGE